MDIEIRHPKLGKPKIAFPFRDGAGHVLGYECRFNNRVKALPYTPMPDGSFDNSTKERYEKDDKGSWKGWGETYPISGQNLLKKYPDAAVIVLEGPKCVLAAQKMLPAPKYVCVTWPGGTQAVRKVDFSPLAGRKTLWWPDNDGTGLRAMWDAYGGICLDLPNAGAAKFFLCPQDFASGWDAADAYEEGWDVSKINRYIVKHDEWWEIKKSLVFAWDNREKEKQQDAKIKKPTPKDEGIPLAFSEDAVSLKFSEKSADDIKWCNGWGVWVEWTGKRWEKDESSNVFTRIRNLCRKEAYALAKFQQENKKPQTVARAVAARKYCQNVEGFCRTDPRHQSNPAMFDSEPYMLGIPGGTINLETGEQTPPNRSRFITKSTSIVPEKRESELWLSFLSRATGGDEGLERYLQKMAGYCLTGTSTAHIAFFLYGPAATGKSRFVEILHYILGTYSIASQVSMLTPRGNEHATEIANLQGARLVVLSETEEGHAIAESRFKSIVAGDALSARFMRQDFFTFKPICKLVLHGNHRPRLRSTDDSMKRRLHVVPFEEVIPIIERDPTLPQKLEAEAPAILAWAIAGTRMWLDEGLEPPRAIEGANESYFDAEDIVNRWMETSCDVGDQYMTARTELWQSWKAWAERNGEHPRSNRWLFGQLRDRGCKEFRGGKGRMFSGIGVYAEYIEYQSDLYGGKGKDEPF